MEGVNRKYLDFEDNDKAKGQQTPIGLIYPWMYKHISVW